MVVSSRVYCSYRRRMTVQRLSCRTGFCNEELLVTLLPFCLSMNRLSGSGARLFMHLKINLRKHKSLKLSKFSELYFWMIRQWWYLTGFFSIIFRVWLYRERMCLVAVGDAWAQTVMQYEMCEKIIACM